MPNPVERMGLAGRIEPQARPFARLGPSSGRPKSGLSPIERFVSGSAAPALGQVTATRPFVDVQSVLCRTASSSQHFHHWPDQFKYPTAADQGETAKCNDAIDLRGSPCRRVRPQSHLCRGDFDGSTGGSRRQTLTVSSHPLPYATASEAKAGGVSAVAVCS